METILLDTKLVDERRNKLSSLNTRFNNVTNSIVWDINYSATINVIKNSSKYIDNIKHDFISNINYLNDVKNNMVDLDTKYSRLEPTDYEGSLKNYNNLEVKYAKKVIGKSAKAFDYIGGYIDETGKAVKNKNGYGALFGTVFSIGSDTYDFIKEKKYKKGVAEWGKYLSKTGKSLLGFGTAIGKVSSSVNTFFGDFLLDGTNKLFGNLKEYGQINNRAVVETAAEWAIGYAKKNVFKWLGKAVAPVITGAIVTVFPVAAPFAPLINAAVGEVAGIVMEAAADYACEKITGEDVEEFLGDTVTNLADKATNGWIGKDSKRAGLFSD